MNTLTNQKDGISFEHAEKLFFHVFGKCKIRKNLRLSLTRLMEDMLKNQQKIDYSYYLKKNCPKMPDWKLKKADFIDRFDRILNNVCIKI